MTRALLSGMPPRTRRVALGLLSAHLCHMLIGACNPMLCPFHPFTLTHTYPHTHPSTHLQSGVLVSPKTGTPDFDIIFDPPYLALLRVTTVPEGVVYITGGGWW